MSSPKLVLPQRLSKNICILYLSQDTELCSHVRIGLIKKSPETITRKKQKQINMQQLMIEDKCVRLF